MAIEEKVVSLAAGGIHSLALTESGRVLSWGDDHRGQCGVTRRVGVLKPAQVTRIQEEVVAVGAGFDTSFALTKDGKGIAWGWNEGEAGMELPGAKIVACPIPIVGLDADLLKIPFGPGGRTQGFGTLGFAQRQWNRKQLAL